MTPPSAVSTTSTVTLRTANDDESSQDNLVVSSLVETTGKKVTETLEKLHSWPAIPTPAPPGCLERHVRPIGHEPPLKPHPWLTLLAYSTLISTFMLWPAHNLWSVLVFAGAVRSLMHYSDAYASNAMSTSIRSLRKGGYTDTQIQWYIHHNGLVIPLVCRSIILLANNGKPWEVVAPQALWTMVSTQPMDLLIAMLGIVWNHAVSDVLFGYLHKQLHTHPLLIRYHVFHHLCTESSWTTNFLFHPVDFYIEFVLPLFVPVCTHAVIGNDLCFIVALITYIIVGLVSHVPYFDAHHTHHHAACNQQYQILEKRKVVPSGRHGLKHLLRNGYGLSLKDST